MKLLIIITDYGSFNNFLSELALKISQNPEFEICVICSEAKVININDKNDFNSQLKFYFVNIPRKINPLGEWSAARKIQNIINIEKPDLVHSHFTTATFPMLLLKKSKVQYWATFHGLGINASSGLKKVVFTLVETMCFLRLHSFFTVNNEDYNLVKKYFNHKVKKYDCLGFGCDINKFDKENVSFLIKKEIKVKYGINEDHVVIAFTGRFVNFKGFHLVIKSFQLLVKSYPNKLKLILMGGPDPIHPTGLNEKDEAFLNNSKDVINIGFTSDVEQYLAVTDIFLFPSKKEGLPTCSLEALAMGVPVITFNTRGNNDLIKDKYNGLLLEPDDNITKEIKSIVDAVIWIIDNEYKRNILKKNALNDRANYSRDRFVNEQIDYYTNFKNNGNK